MCVITSLAALAPRVLLLDPELPGLPDPLNWAARHAPSIPLILLVSAVDTWPTPARADAVALAMPFRRGDLRRAVAMAERTGQIEAWRRVPGSAG